jgi:hypothetical protein
MHIIEFVLGLNIAETLLAESYAMISRPINQSSEIIALSLLVGIC